ncbi:MAG: hypothetical protein PHN84_00145 [Desulfuromonadaceae bacterium]|nr:hypothetical protein [Desulfuromonadaceae bacterium]MDD2854997.1 hypothetical protein [Desulfuromonadaceae bacterium]
MAGHFFQRLRTYYTEVASVLRGEASVASVFPNMTDVGMSRENLYAEFLRLHAPSKCNVFLGGFLFGEDGTESAQLDVIVTTDTTPRFNFHNKNGLGKSFSPVEGTLGIASIKSTLNKNELENALAGIASIPASTPLGSRVNPSFNVKDYEDWPYKIIYASKGISATSLLTHLNNYYIRNPSIQFGRRPNIIHVSGKYVILRATNAVGIWDANKHEDMNLEAGTFHLIDIDPDLQGIMWVLNALQQNATASTHILYSYIDILNRLNGLPEKI